MKGNAAVFVILGALALILMGFLVFKGSLGFGEKTTILPSPSPKSLSEDPKYKDVKEKYNLNEEQLQILSTVNPDDNE